MRCSLTKTEFFDQLELLDLVGCHQELFPMMIVVRKLDDVFLVLPHQPGWQYQEIGTDRFQGGCEVLRWQTKPFEPVNNVCSKKQDLKERHIGGPRVRGNFAEGVVVKAFPDVFLYSGSGSVKPIDPPGAGSQVGNEDVVDIFFVLEKTQLLRLDGIVWDGTADHHKAMEFVPPHMDFFPELSYFPTVLQSLEFAALSSGSDVGVHPGYDHIAASYVVEEPNDSPAIKARIHPEADSASGDILGHFGQADFEKGDRPSRTGRIARPKPPMPELVKMAFETEQGMVGRSAALFGIVANPGSLLLPIDHYDDRVQIEDEGGALVGQREEINPQAVVEPGHLADGLGGQTFQESAQAGLIWELIEPQHFQEGPVVLQDLGLVDASQSHDDGEDQGQKEFGRMVRGTSLRGLNVSLEQVAQPQLVAKTLNQPHPTKVCEVGFVE